MHSPTKMLGVGIFAFVIGVGSGIVAGFELASRLWYRRSLPSISADGHQALGVLMLLDRKEDGKVRDLMEMQIDSTLVSLRAMQLNGSLNDKVMLRVYDELKEYRAKHPRTGS